MVSHKEILTEGERWRQTHYIDDIFYYGTNDLYGSYIYMFTDNNAAELKLKISDMIVSSYVPDAEGNNYFLAILYHGNS